jgi:UDP-N-acetylmuramate dehydrogenase
MKKYYDAPLDKYSGYRCGGNAEMLIEVEDRNDLQNVISDLKKDNYKWCLLGKGYNTLISDKGVAGAVLRLKGDFGDIEMKDNYIKTGAGVDLARLLKVSVENELSGLEFLAGIPGTIGAAVYGNCGTKKESVGDLISEIEIYDTVSGLFKRLENKDVGFGYRNCSLAGNIIVTEAVFKLKTDNKTDIINKIRQNIELKNSRQPVSSKSCGCVFKNPDNGRTAAAELIQSAGLSGMSIGGAQVSDLHVNFIVNKNNATSSDIWELIKKIRNIIKDKYGIELELEINLLGEGFDS